jgi:hypothetical protein
MTTRRETILSAVMTALAGTAQVGSRIYRSRVEPIARQESPAIVVEPLTDQADNSVVPKLDWQMTVRIAIIVRGAVPDQLADPIVEDVHKKLLSNGTLTGLVIEIVPLRVAFDSMDADQPAGVVLMDYSIRYRTQAGDLSLA